MATQFINDPSSLVQEAIAGLIDHNPSLARLDGFPDIKVVVSRESIADKSKVAIISGGGSGHEPAHVGYVGKGMLSAAVCGEVFASPSAEAVLAAIRAAAAPGGPGVLLIIKCYTGDRLHFGLAAEQAKSEGIRVEMVVVGEDTAIDTPGLAGRRGLAGTVLVHKVAGAVAAAGGSLEQVAAAAQAVAGGMATLGVASRVCTLPGKPPTDRLAPGEIEVGLGIHGEPGHKKMKALPAAQLVQLMVSHIARSPFFNLQGGERVVLLVNNLGASTPLEMSCIAREAIAYLQGSLQVQVDRCFVGPFMTSLDMAGFSLTLLRATCLGEGEAARQKLLDALDHPVGAFGWPALSTPAAVSPAPPVPLPPQPGGARAEAQVRPSELSEQGRRLEACIHAAADALVAGAPQLNEMDAKVGDGDCGDTLLAGARAILSDLSAHYPLNDTAATLAAVAQSVRHAVGGTSGALYDVGLTAAARGYKEAQAAGASGQQAWAAALVEGVAAIQKYGGAEPGSRSMLDALLPASSALDAALSQGPAVAARAAADAAVAGAASTQGMAAGAGRASYVPADILSSTPDPGAHAVGLWLAAVAAALAQ